MSVAVTHTRRHIAHAALLASASFLALTFASPAQAQCVTSPGSPPLNNLPTDAVVTCSGTTNGQTINLNGISVDVIVSAGSTLSNSTITINGPDARVNFGSTTGGVTTLLNVAVASPTNPAVTNVRFTNVSGTNILAQVGGQASGLRFLSGSAITAVPGSITLAGATNNPGPGGNGALTIEGGSSVFALGAANGNYLLATGAGNETVTISDSGLLAASDGLLLSTGAGSDLINIWGNSDIQSFGGATPSIDGGADFDRIRWRGGTAAVIHNVNVTNVEEAVFESLSAGAPLVMRGSAGYSTVFVGGAGVTRFDDIAALGSNTAAVQVVPGSTLQLNANTLTTFNHVFSGSGTIRQTEGVNFYNGNSASFSGTFIIDFNRAILTNANAVGTADIVNNSLLFSGDFDLANDISGTGAVAKFGPGIGRLSGNNTFSGDLDIQGGTLVVASVNSLGTGTIRTSSGGVVLQIENAANETLANDVIGGIALVKNGAGELNLTGANTYSGGTTINAGAIRVDSFARLGTGIVLANQGASLILDYNGAGQLLQTTAFLNGAGSFIKEGSGDVVMNQTSTYTGGTTIRAGRLGLNNGDALGTGAIQIDSGAELGVGGIVLNNNLTGSGLVRKTANNLVELYGNNSGFTGTIQVADGILYATNGNALGAGTLQIDNGTAARLDNATDTVVLAGLTGSGSFEKQGAGRATLTGNGSTFTGGVSITGGALQIAGEQHIGNASVFIGSAGTLALDTAGNTQLGNFIYGDGRLVKTGSGTVFITNANTYTGGTDIQQGALRVTNTSFLGTGPITVQSGAALNLSIAGAQTLSQSVTGAGILRKSNTGDLTLLSNGLTGGVDIVGGRVIVSSTAALGGGPVTTAADTQLVFNNSATEVSNNPISGAGAVTKDGTGLLVMNNANSYTGGTIINSGRIGLNNGMGLGTGDVLVLQGAILGIGGVALANNVSGAGQIIKTANNTAILTGTNSHSGGTDIQQGRIVVYSPAALGSGPVTMGTGTVLDITYAGTTNVALNNTLTGAGALVKNGSGTVVVNTSNSFSGGTTINAGRLGLNFGDGLGSGQVQIGSGAQLGIGDIALGNNLSGAGSVVKTSGGNATLGGTNTFSGGLDIQGGSVFVANIASLGTGTVSTAAGTSLAIGNTGNQTLANSLTGAGSLLKSGTGDLTLTGNALTGGMTISGGRVLANTNPLSLGSGAVSVGAGAELVYTTASNATFANGISGAGTLRKLGTAQLTFTNPFAIGALAVDAGSVRINTVATTNATVGSAARLDGTGRIVGNLVNNGTVAPGNSIGTLTVQGNYTHNAGSVLEIEFDGAGNIDLLDVTGNATLNGGTLRFVSVGGAEGSGGTFLRTGGTLTGTFATVETVGAQLPLAVIYQPNAALMAPSVLTARPSTFNAQALAAADAALAFIGSIPDADSVRLSGNRIWMNGFGGWGDRSATGSTLAYSHDTRGVSGGVNLAAGEGLTLGAAFGWAGGDIELASNGGGGEQDSLIGALHARFAGAGYSLGAGVLYGTVDQATLRNVSFNGFSGSVTGDTRSDLFGGFVEAGASLGSASGIDLSASARASYIQQTQEGYTESGLSPLRLTLPELQTDTFEGEALLTARTSLWDGSFAAEDTPAAVDLRLDLGARYLGNLGDRAIPVTFAVSNAGIVLAGDDRNSLHGVAGLAMEYTTAGGITIDLGYRGEFGATDRHSVRAGVSFAF